MEDLLETLALPMSKWAEITPTRTLIKELLVLIERAARLATYLDYRQAEYSHEIAVDAQNKTADAIRAVMGQKPGKQVTF